MSQEKNNTLELRTPKEITSYLSESAIIKTEKKWLHLFLLGICSGLFLGISCIATTNVTYAIENPGLAKMVSALLFPFGLTMIILTGSELFTGNCLIFTAVLQKKVKLSGMFRNWSLVFLGNFVACVCVAFFYGTSQIMTGNNGSIAIYAVNIALAKLSLPWLEAFFLGVFCNFLVTVAVFMATAGKDPFGKFLGATVPVSLFVMAGFEHCIANMYYIPVALVLKNSEFIQYAQLDTSLLTVEHFLIKNLIPVTLGNILGGCIFAVVIWFCYGKNNQN